MGTILEDVKKALGIVPGYDAFDDQILMYINSARMDLAQLGPKCLGIIEKESQWSVFPDINDEAAIKSYISLKIRLMFDPPGNSFLVTAYQKLIEEAAWRLIYQTEGKS